MKKLILGMMLLLGSLSFSSQDNGGIDSHGFYRKLIVEVNHNVNVSPLNDRLLCIVSSIKRN